MTARAQCNMLTEDHMKVYSGEFDPKHKCITLPVGRSRVLRAFIFRRVRQCEKR